MNRWHLLGWRRRLTVALFAAATAAGVALSAIAATQGVHTTYGLVLGIYLALAAGGLGGLADR